MPTRTHELKDGTVIDIRRLAREDLAALAAFFEALPAADRRFLRVDVTDRSVLERLIRATEKGEARRIVAAVGAEIVGHGAVELPTEGWSRHTAELRLAVAAPYRRRRVGTLLARELYGLAAAAGVEDIVVRLMRPQAAARAVFERLGFHEDATLTDYVQDRDGHRQDLVLMRCDLAALWAEMDDLVGHTDWGRTR